MKKCFVLILGLAVASVAFADVGNGDFDDDSLNGASSINVAVNVDNGWYAHASDEYDVDQNDLYREYNGSTTEHSWFGQIYTDNKSTYGSGTLLFSISYLVAIDSAAFKYEIYGTDSTNETATSFALNVSDDPRGSSTAWNILDSGSVDIDVDVEIDGDSDFYQKSLSLGSTSYNYIAVRFTLDVLADDGSLAVDEISVVPEPSTATMLAFVGGLAFLIRRHFIG